MSGQVRAEVSVEVQVDPPIPYGTTYAITRVQMRADALQFAQAEFKISDKAFSGGQRFTCFARRRLKDGSLGAVQSSPYVARSELPARVLDELAEAARVAITRDFKAFGEAVS